MYLQNEDDIQKNSVRHQSKKSSTASGFLASHNEQDMKSDGQFNNFLLFMLLSLITCILVIANFLFVKAIVSSRKAGTNCSFKYTRVSDIELSLSEGHDDMDSFLLQNSTNGSQTPAKHKPSNREDMVISGCKDSNEHIIMNHRNLNELNSMNSESSADKSVAEESNYFEEIISQSSEEYEGGRYILSKSLQNFKSSECSQLSATPKPRKVTCFFDNYSNEIIKMPVENERNQTVGIVLVSSARNDTTNSLDHENHSALNLFNHKNSYSLHQESSLLKMDKSEILTYGKSNLAMNSFSSILNAGRPSKFGNLSGLPKYARCAKDPLRISVEELTSGKQYSDISSVNDQEYANDVSSHLPGTSFQDIDPSGYDILPNKNNSYYHHMNIFLVEKSKRCAMFDIEVEKWKGLRAILGSVLTYVWPKK